MSAVVRNQNDSVFRMLYKDPKNALELYNGLSGANYTDETQLKFNTLENAVYMNIKNDVSFIIQDTTNLYEQQTTWNPNMPLRDLYYIADIFHSYEKNEQGNTIYGSKTIMLPNPEFVVFYNGKGNYPEYSELKLSDAFVGCKGNPSLELIVKVYNVSTGKNELLKSKCPILAQYIQYTELVTKYSKVMTHEEAVIKAVDECIENGVLRDFLMRQKSEVVKMSIYIWDMEEQQRRLENQLREEFMEQGLEEGRRLGIQQGIQQGMQQGIQQGMQQGMQQGKELGQTIGEATALVGTVRKLEDKGYSLEAALELIEVSKEEYDKAKELIESTKEV